MADVVNLRRARKDRDRALKEEQAAVNRAKFGRRKDERRTEEKNRALTGKRLDQAKREE